MCLFVVFYFFFCPALSRVFQERDPNPKLDPDPFTPFFPPYIYPFLHKHVQSWWIGLLNHNRTKEIFNLNSNFITFIVLSIVCLSEPGLLLLCLVENPFVCLCVGLLTCTVHCSCHCNCKSAFRSLEWKWIFAKTNRLPAGPELSPAATNTEPA